MRKAKIKIKKYLPKAEFGTSLFNQDLSKQYEDVANSASGTAEFITPQVQANPMEGLATTAVNFGGQAVNKIANSIAQSGKLAASQATSSASKAVAGGVKESATGAARATSSAAKTGISNGLSTGAAVGSAALGVASDLINLRPGYGNDKGQSAQREKRIDATSQGIHAAAGAVSMIPGVGSLVGLGLEGLNFLLKGFGALGDKIKEKREGPNDPTWQPTMNNVMANNWSSIHAKYGLPLAMNGLPMFTNGGDTSIQNIEGPSHAQGGIPLDTNGDGQPDVEAEGGEAKTQDYIFSDKLGTDKDGKLTLDPSKVVSSFADKVKKIEKKHKGKTSDLDMKTKQLSLESVKQMAEMARQMKEAQEQAMLQAKQQKQIMKYGGYLPKAGNSLPVLGGNSSAINTQTPWNFDQGSYVNWIKQQPEYLNKSVSDLNSKEAQELYRARYAENLMQTHGPLAVKEFNAKKPVDPTYLRTILYPPNTSPIGNSRLTGYDPKYDLKVNNPSIFINPKTGKSSPSGISYPDELFTKDSKLINKDRNSLGFGNLNVGNELSEKEKDTMLTPGDKLSLASMIPSALYNFGMGLKKPEKEKFTPNNYANDALALASHRFDDRDLQAKLIGDMAAAKGNISDMKGIGPGATLANLSGMYNNLFANRQQLEGEKQKINLGLDQQQAQAMLNLGEANRGDWNRVKLANSQNKAAKQAFMAEGISNMSQGLATTGQGMNAGLLNKIGINALSEISSDFNIAQKSLLYSPGFQKLLVEDPDAAKLQLEMLGLMKGKTFTPPVARTTPTKKTTKK